MITINEKIDLDRYTSLYTFRLSAYEEVFTNGDESKIPEANEKLAEFKKLVDSLQATNAKNVDFYVIEVETGPILMFVNTDTNELIADLFSSKKSNK